MSVYDTFLNFPGESSVEVDEDDGAFLFSGKETGEGKAFEGGAKRERGSGARGWRGRKLYVDDDAMLNVDIGLRERMARMSNALDAIYRDARE